MPIIVQLVSLSSGKSICILLSTLELQLLSIVPSLHRVVPPLPPPELYKCRADVLASKNARLSRFKRIQSINSLAALIMYEQMYLLTGLLRNYLSGSEIVPAELFLALI